jgi:hypothetical protein
MTKRCLNALDDSSRAINFRSSNNGRVDKADAKLGVCRENSKIAATAHHVANVIVTVTSSVLPRGGIFRTLKSSQSSSGAAGPTRQTTQIEGGAGTNEARC